MTPPSATPTISDDDSRTRLVAPANGHGADAVPEVSADPAAPPRAVPESK